MRRTWIAVLLVLALSGIAAGCGGSNNVSDTSPTDQWATGFCGAVGDWKSSLEDIASRLNDPSNLSSDGLQSAAKDARAATDTLVSSLRDLGAPDTQSGQEIKSAVDSLSSTLDATVATIEDTAKGVSNLTQLPGAISTITASVSSLTTAVSQTVTTIDNADAKGELKTSLENAPECSGITG